MRSRHSVAPGYVVRQWGRPGRSRLVGMSRAIGEILVAVDESDTRRLMVRTVHLLQGLSDLVRAVQLAPAHVRKGGASPGQADGS